VECAEDGEEAVDVECGFGVTGIEDDDTTPLRNEESVGLSDSVAGIYDVQRAVTRGWDEEDEVQYRVWCDA